MSYKKMLIVSFIFIVCFSIMPIVKAETKEFQTITLQEIANKIQDDTIKEVAESIIEEEKDKIIVNKTVKENELIIKITGYEGTVTLETTFSLNGDILSSTKIDRGEEGDMVKIDKFHYYITEEVFKIITKLMGYDEDIWYYLFEHDDIANYTLEKEGIQIKQEANGRYRTYKIDLSKKVTISVFRIHFIKAILLYEEKYESNSTDAPEAIAGVYITYNDGSLNIRRNGKILTTLTIQDTIITSEPIKIGENMSDEEKMTNYAILYFLDCIGQECYGYKEHELFEAITSENVKNYNFEQDGFERVNLGNGKYQYKIDISKKVPLNKEIKEDEKPKDDNNLVTNVSKDNKIVDNTIAKGKIPQTGYELTTVIIAILVVIIATIATFIMIQHNK